VRDRVAYGDAPSQTGDLSIPQVAGPRPVMVLVHGGYWKLGIDRHSLDEIADSLGQAGYAVWNIDYRRIGEGGGWPGTFDDVAAAVDKLATLVPERPLDLERVGIMGHSAGGELAFWAAARKNLKAGARWSNPVVSPIAAVSLAGVVDLAMAATTTATGDDAAKIRESVISLLGGTPAQQPERYAAVSAIQRLPLGVPQLLVHGAKDAVVPIEQSRAYVAAAADTSDRVRLIELPSADHFDVIKIGKPGWSEIVNWLRANVGDPNPTGA
jgi:acetyl esterase/lipase